MVTIKQLQKQIADKKARIKKAQDNRDLRLEKDKLSNELRLLNRGPGTTRNIELARRTGRGFKRLAIAGGKALIKQGRLIKEQQERDAALQRRSSKVVAKGIKRRGKKVSKKLRRTNKKISKGLKRSRR